MLQNHVPARAISNAAYHNASHSFGDQHKQIVAVMTQERIPMTGAMVSKLLGNHDMVLSNVRSRLLELCQGGRVVIDRVGICPISGQKARFYRLLRPGETAPPLTPASFTRKELLMELDALRDLLKQSERRAHEQRQIAEEAKSITNELAAKLEACEQRLQPPRRRPLRPELSPEQQEVVE